MFEITVDDLIEKINDVISDESKLAELTRFVCEYCNTEKEIILDDILESVQPVISIYLEFAEAFGDKNIISSLIRLKEVLIHGKDLNGKVEHSLEDSMYEAVIEDQRMKIKLKKNYQENIKRPKGDGIYLVEKVAFALDFEEIKQLCVKYKFNMIDANNLSEQIKELYPLYLDIEKLMIWGFLHLNDDNLVLSKLA